MNWFDVHAGTVQAWATIVLVAVTIVYAVLTGRAARAADRNVDVTRQLVVESRLARVASLDALLMPMSVTYLKPHAATSHNDPAIPEQFRVEIRNFGPAAAFDIRVGYRIGEMAPVHVLGSPIASGTATHVAVELQKALLSLPEQIAANKLPPEATYLGLLPVVDFEITISYKTISGAEHVVRSRHQLRHQDPAQSTGCQMLGLPEVVGGSWRLATPEGSSIEG
jgi:hypothetical protein